MEKITIETTQNVDIEYEIASVGERIVATIIDTLILIGYIFAVIITLSSIEPHLRGNAEIITVFIIFLPVTFYSVLFETFMNGRTPGKAAMKIKVMRVDGRQPGIGNYLMRWITRIIEIWATFGLAALITVIVNGRGQRLGDMAAGTLVIKMRSKQNISNTAFEKVDDAYVPVFPEAVRLSDSDASTVKRVLNLTVSDADEITFIENKLAAKLKAYLGVQTSLSDRQFLQTLLKDYNITSGKL